MACVPVSSEMSYLLDALRSWPFAPDVLGQLRAMPEWEQARSWGWVMESEELTCTGLRHAGRESPQGRIR